MKRKIKWLAVTAIVISLLVFGKLLPAEPLSQRAIVVGFGIDAEDDDTLSVSAQILNPGAKADQSGAETNVVTVKDKTISGAMGKISERSSKTVALTHCNVVFIHKKIAENNDIYSVINYLITNSYLSENAYLFLTEEKSEKLLNSKTAFGNNASLYMQSLVGINGDFSAIASKTLQCFVVGYHSLGATNWLPILKLEEVTPKQSDNESDDSEYVFNANSVAVFRKNRLVGSYEKDCTQALTYINSKVKKGQLFVKGDNDENILLYVIGNSVKKSFDLDTKTATVKLKLNCILKEIIDVGDEDKYIDRTEMSEDEIKRVENDVKENIVRFYTEMQSKEVDLYNFLESFNSKFGKKAKDLKISDVNLSLDVTLEYD